jgi:Protein of unknown function (DUF1761)
MEHVNPVAVAVAAGVAFVLGGAYYGALGGRLARLAPVYAEGGRMGPATIVLELVRCLVLAVVVAGLAGAIGIAGLGPALLLAAALWVGFPAVLFAGSVLHERIPAALAAIHAGDWLLKLVVITGILALWG